jgi:dienelactone hydrolase
MAARYVRILALFASIVLSSVALSVANSAVAADTPDAAPTLRQIAERAADLTFPTEISPAFGTPRMALFKPEGAGPFPALVLLHQCGGLGGAAWQNRSMVDWAREAVARGYVAFIIDALGPRDVRSVCLGPRNNVTFARGVRDALQAAAHLRRQPFVDKARVALAGYSWGAMVGLLASSRGWGEALKEDERFAAVASFYPGCFHIQPPAAPAYDILREDVDRPLLVLMGDADTETPAADCVTRLQPAQASGAPVEWHVYAGATHCWDCSTLDGFSKVDVRGNHVTYRYDPATTQDSATRLFAFLERQMGPAKK